MKTNILGVEFDNISFDQTQEKIWEFIQGNKPKSLYTPNPEIVMRARKDPDFMEVLNRGDLVIPDSVGIVLASRFGQNKIPRRVTGYDTVQALFARIKNTDKTVYFYGAPPGVAELAKAKMEEEHKGLKIIGVSHGFIDEPDQARMIDEIKALKPDILIVGLGAPKQERWIERHKDNLPCKLLIGAGGSFDGMSGRIPRVPKFIGDIGLEWLYRLIREPSRFKRQLQLPLFMLVVIKERFISSKKAHK